MPAWGVVICLRLVPVVLVRAHLEVLCSAFFHGHVAAKLHRDSHACS
jgi:hypothetical protein